MEIAEILSKEEKKALEGFAENSLLKQAVKKVLLFGIYYNGTLLVGKDPQPLRNFALNIVANNPGLADEVIGSETKAAWKGISLLENGFVELDKFKKVDETKKDEQNPAR